MSAAEVAELLNNAEIFSGEILKIDRYGEISKSEFDDSKLYNYYYPFNINLTAEYFYEDDEYLESLKSIALIHGISEEYVDYLLEEGFTTDDIEELIYCH